VTLLARIIQLFTLRLNEKYLRCYYFFAPDNWKLIDRHQSAPSNCCMCWFFCRIWFVAQLSEADLKGACVNSTWPESAVMMTLSGIAYSSDILGQLKNTHYATQGQWSVVWGPCDDSYGNLAYVAKNASSENYALVIRGSETSISFDTIYNWFYNLYITWQSKWLYLPTQPQAMLAYGSWVQASNLTTASWNGQTLGSFLTQGIPRDATIAVTGHSLGGNLATVLASWISFVRSPEGTQQDLNTEVYTFAAPSAGNMQFAEGFNARFPKSYRYWNTLDVVPRTWDNLLDLNFIYDNIGIATPGWIQDSVIALEGILLASEWDYGSYYEQPNGGGSPLNGIALPANHDYLTEVAHQHQVNVYLGLLNAPLLDTTSKLLAGTLQPGSFLPRPVIEKHQRPDRSAPRPVAGAAGPFPRGLAMTAPSIVART
jgi:triacylglycerol lipase